ncbi:YkvA family protein [Xanthobacter sp. V4C-4]|uniref:YkvA family protein n=1 Tax=Xanthobacter cornucopiae TaxID=3119924 RepID=UPI0037272F51
MGNSSAATRTFDWRALAAGGGPSRAESDAARVRRDFWQKLFRSASFVPFAEDATAAYYAAFDKTTPLKVRAALLGVLAYFVMPVDAIPDVLPVLGFTDDTAVLMGALKLLAEHIKPGHRAAARAALEAMRRRKA